MRPFLTMNFDYFTTAALLDELNQTLAGGRLQDVLQLDEWSLGFEIYAHQQRHYLYLTAEPDQPRLHLVGDKLRKGVPSPNPLVLLMNSYVEGGKLLAIRQPAWERILMLDILHAEREFTLIVEPIERRANVILVEAGIIRECIRRVGADENRVRQILPNHPYELPPPQNKLTPQEVTLEHIKQALETDPNAKAFQALTKICHGVSPLLAKEILYRATGDISQKAETVSPRELFQAFQNLMQPLLAHEWEIGNILEDETVAGFAVYRVTHRGKWQPMDSLSAALMAYYGDLTGDQAYAAAKKPIQAQLEQAQKRLSGKLFSLKKQERDDSDILYLKQAGELLLTYQSQIGKHQTEFVAQYDPEGEPLTIKLDPLLTAVENAQRYFEKYDKGKRSRESLPELILETERELRYLAQLETDLELASHWNDIGEVQDALVEAGYWRGAKRRQTSKSGRSTPLKVYTEEGIVIWVGRNSRQNEEVTFEKGSPDDLWLHVRGVPGAHVIIKTTGRPTPPTVIEKAASLAVYYSKARAEGSAEVIITERKHVRKIKGGKTGMVRVSEQTRPSIRAIPHSEEGL